MTLRRFETLDEMERIHKKEVNEFPFIWVFAFTDKEFITQMSEEIKKRKPQCSGVTTMDGIKKHVVGIGAGGYVFKEDEKRMNDMFRQHGEERKIFNSNKDNLVKSILSEMNKHEYGYTREPYDTLFALDKTEHDLETDTFFAEAWKKAEQKCFDAFDEVYREEKSLERAYGTWRDDYELEG